MDNEYKVKDYTRKAIQNYNAKFDRITINFDKGTKDKIIAIAGSNNISKFVNDIVQKEISSKQGNNNELPF